MTLEVLNEWGIRQKIIGITADRASANRKMVQLLKEKLITESNTKVAAMNELLYSNCSAHMVNRLVFKFSKAVKKIPDNVFSRSRKARKEVKEDSLFLICWSMVFGSNLPKPNITRWFSEIRLSAAFVLKIELAPHFFTQHTQFDHLWHYQLFRSRY